MRFLLFLIVCSAPVAEARNYRLLDIERVGVDAWRVEDHRDAYFPYNKPGTEGEQWTVGAAFLVDFTLVAYNDWSWYWDNRPHMTSTTAQVREAGWEWETGVSYRRKIDLYWYHHSRHILEADVSGKYPLDNSYGLRVIFYERKNPW